MSQQVSTLQAEKGTDLYYTVKALIIKLNNLLGLLNEETITMDPNRKPMDQVKKIQESLDNLSSKYQIKISNSDQDETVVIIDIFCNILCQIQNIFGPRLPRKQEGKEKKYKITDYESLIKEAIENLKLLIEEMKKLHQIENEKLLEDLKKKEAEIQELRKENDDLKEKHSRRVTENLELSSSIKMQTSDFNTKIQELIIQNQEQQCKITTQNKDLQELRNFISKIQKPDETSCLTRSEFYKLYFQTQDLRGLTSSEWKIENNMTQSDNGGKVYVSVVSGIPQSGKTFLVEQILEKNLSYKGKQDEGFGITYHQGIAFLDTKSLMKPMTNLDIKAENLTKNENEHQILRDILISFYNEVSSIIIYVVSGFSVIDQKMISQFAKGTRILVLHNYSQIEDKDECLFEFNQLAKKSLKVESKFYGFQVDDDLNNKFYVDSENKLVTHLIFGRKGTKAGDYFNVTSAKYIMKQIFGSTDSRKIDIVNSFINHLRKNLMERIEGMQEKDLELTQSNTIKWKVDPIFKNISPQHMLYLENKNSDLLPKYCLIFNQEQEYLFLIIECPNAIMDSIEAIIEQDYPHIYVVVEGKKSLYLTDDFKGDILEDNRRTAQFKIITKKFNPGRFEFSKQFTHELKGGNLILKFFRKIVNKPLKC